MPRYRFPTTPLARLARAAGLADVEYPCRRAPAESIAEGIARTRRAGSDPAAFPPSLILERDPTPTGPAPACFPVRPNLARTLDGREVVTVAIDEGTSLYATGEVAGPLLRNGRRTVCWNTDKPGYTDADPSLYQSHPWVLAVRADGSSFGVLLDTTWRTEIDLTRAHQIRFATEGPPCWVYLIDGSSPQQVLERLATLIGTMPLPARWTLGYHQCRYSDEPAARVEQIAREFRQRRIPCDVIWMDIDYMDRFRIFTFDPVKFPDPRALNAHLHERGFKSVWMIDPGPAADPGYFVYDQGCALDAWITDWRAEPFVAPVWPPRVVWPDFTRADVGEWWGGLYRDFMATGVDGVWNDMNEPAIVREDDAGMPIDNLHRGGLGNLPPGPHAQYHNAYGQLMVRATHAGVARANPDKRPFVLTRANLMGGHRYAATWTGDNTATWNDVRWSISMVVNLGLSGQPFAGPDLGGFIHAGDPGMYARWFGFGSMLPFCRGHAANNNIEKEPWAFGPETEATCRRALERRYRLLPYLYTVFEASSRTGVPVNRPVFFADPADPRLRGEDRSFLVGSDLLVLAQPDEGWGVEHALPAGRWRAFEPVEGPPDPNLADLRARPGAIIPLGPVVQHTGERPVDPLTLIVSLDEGGEAAGELYEDAGDGFGYRSGDFCRLGFVARRHGGVVRVTTTRLGGDRPATDRVVEVRVLTESGVRTAAGRSGGAIDVPIP
ncbi:MAG: glycoside hydrolase family 31 protein [Phycisphaerales bacterium]